MDLQMESPNPAPWAKSPPFKPFEYHSLFVGGNTASSIGNTDSYSVCVRFVVHFDMSLHGVFQCIRYEVVQYLFDAHRVVLYLAGGYRIPGKEFHSCRNVPFVLGNTFLDEFCRIEPFGMELYVSGLYFGKVQNVVD